MKIANLAMNIFIKIGRTLMQWWRYTFFLLILGIAALALTSLGGKYLFPILDNYFRHRSPESDLLPIITSFNALIALLTAAGIVTSIVFANKGYNALRETERKKVTIQFISKQVHDKAIVEMFSQSRFLRTVFGKEITYQSVSDRYNKYVAKMSKNVGEADYEQFTEHRASRDVIIQLLNYYETLAIGIDNEALDPDMLKSWWRSSLIADWSDLYLFILDYRKFHFPTFLDKLENLVEDWATLEEKRRIRELQQRHEDGKYPLKKEYRYQEQANGHGMFVQTNSQIHELELVG